MADSKKNNNGLAVMSIIMLLTLLLSILEAAKQESNGNVLLYVRGNPLVIFSLLFILGVFFFSYLKNNSKQVLLEFFSKHFLKYLAKFMAFIVTIYISFFVITTYNINDFKDFLITLLIYLSLFLLFLFSEWFGNLPFRPIGLVDLKALFRRLWEALSRFLIPGLIIATLYYLLTNIPLRTCISIGVMHSMFILIGFAPAIKRWWVKVLVIAPVGLLQVILLFLILSKDNQNNLTILITSLIGLALTYLSLILSCVLKNDSPIKRWYYKFAEESDA